MEQLFLFQESKDEKLQREMQNLKDQCERIRKSQYAKIGRLNKLYDEIKYELDTFKSVICNDKHTSMPIQSMIFDKDDKEVA